MRDKEKVYVLYTGISINIEQLVEMAINAGSVVYAEPIVSAILHHAALYGLPQLIDDVNKIRRHYGLVCLVTLQETSRNGVSYRPTNPENLAREIFRAMSSAEQQDVICCALGSLRANYPRLFKYRNHWIGIFLVVKDRLDAGMSQTCFLELAIDATPHDWPPKLAINENVFKNMSRDFHIDDPDMAYYEIENNPQRRLCEVFWELLRQQILAAKDGRMTEFSVI